MNSIHHLDFIINIFNSLMTISSSAPTLPLRKYRLGERSYQNEPTTRSPWLHLFIHTYQNLFIITVTTTKI